MKKIIITIIGILLSFDIGLIYIADATANGNSDQDLQQLQQLHLINQSASASQQATQGASSSSQQSMTSSYQNQPTNNQTSNNQTTSNQYSQSNQQPSQQTTTTNQQQQTSNQQQSSASAGYGNNNQNNQGQNGSQQLSTSQVVGEAAFRQVKRNQFPMTPDQIQRFKQAYQETEYATASSPQTPPKPTATSQMVNLAPGTTPPVIRLAQGFVTSLVFLDSTGAPWPITAYDLGNPTAFNIQWDRASNTLMVQASKLYTYGNLAVTLKGLATPVMLTLIPGQDAVDYRVDLRVQGIGPNATDLPVADGMPSGANPVLLGVLDGVPPAGSQTLEVSGGLGEAWLSGDKLFLRTRLTVLSPSWLSTMSSADGTHAYEMQKTPLVLVSFNGKVRQLKIEGL